MANPTQLDHSEVAASRLITQWRDKPKVVGLLKSFMSVSNNIEQVLFQLLDERDIFTAIGEQLDVSGRIVGERRMGKEDEAYRQAILTRISVNKSDGTIPKILELLKAITGTPRPRVWEHFPASTHIYLDRNVTNQTAITADQISPAGVNTRIMFDIRGNSFIPATNIPATFNLVLENNDNLQVDVNGDVGNLIVSNLKTVPNGNKSFLPHSLNTTIINPLAVTVPTQLPTPEPLF